MKTIRIRTIETLDNDTQRTYTDNYEVENEEDFGDFCVDHFLEYQDDRGDVNYVEFQLLDNENNVINSIGYSTI